MHAYYDRMTVFTILMNDFFNKPGISPARLSWNNESGISPTGCARINAINEFVVFGRYKK